MPEAQFAPGLEAQHRRIDDTRYENVYVVGDVHGCRAAAEALLDELEPADDELVLFLGDLVRRGPDSKGVVELVRSTPNALSIRGNNEEKIIDGRRPAEGLSAGDVRWLRSLPAIVSWGSNVAVHGGLHPDRRLDEQRIDDVQSVESVPGDGDDVYWWQRYDGPRRVFFGHVVLRRPFVGEFAVGLDTGCVYGGPLTAFDCGRERTVRVDATTAHRSRPAEKFRNPY
jgi:serine/threonine protein phosphatase 1